MKFSYKKVAAAVVIFTLILSSLLIIIAHRSNNTAVSSYILRNDNGTVALYKDGEIITVYDGIAVDSLPAEDRARLSEGITIDSIDDAQSIIEDYDG
ncbi:MAG: BofC C-terminal domain-containing protein [Clostridia bacterium]|nr:BofC C-terminal domain-containing protein [Clostridia bacterium]